MAAGVALASGGSSTLGWLRTYPDGDDVPLVCKKNRDCLGESVRREDFD